MKRIISISIAVFIVLVFALSAAAEFVTVPPAPKLPDEVINVTASLIVKTRENDSVVFESKAGEDPIKGRIFEIRYTVENKTKEIIYLADVLKEFGVEITDTAAKTQIECWHGKTTGWTTDLSKIAVNPGEAREVTFVIYAITDKAVLVNVVYGNQSYRIEENKPAMFVLMLVQNITTTTTVTETTTEATTQVEKTTEADNITTTTKKVETTKFTPAAVDDEIPETGSKTAIGAVILLGFAVAAVFVIKNKKNK